jgi:hypothetical protein
MFKEFRLQNSVHASTKVIVRRKLKLPKIGTVDIPRGPWNRVASRAELVATLRPLVGPTMEPFPTVVTLILLSIVAAAYVYSGREGGPGPGP